ncbi:four helix bundle protein [Seonamhaeicola aphaedonensis]|uniref:Four helix bundle protein n=1 Tax=Seonamhaeicola aphaedonensis TaxID=1461338 RepID=A0A3D9HH92_9FLAO|nr:four helix bundle protein [Seonamhaeicola aphaedonensis]RED48867.1 four helix bundle protein [Seonamhaeicola aphaedonensis]
MRDFRKLDIWKNGIELVKQIYQLSNKLPSEEKFGLRSQITRAAVSVPSNIAEGCSRNSEVEFKRFLEIAIGSLFEVETQLIIVQELKFIEE